MNNIIVQHIHFEDDVEDVELPPPDLITNFETLQDWLYNICDTEQPQKPIATYHFGVSESADDYAVYLIGRYKYDKDPCHSVSIIDFEPRNMYFLLPKSKFEYLTREQMMERLSIQLKDFTMTDKFRQSFFTNANAIRTEFNGEIIWSK